MTDRSQHTPGPWLVVVDYGPDEDERYGAPQIAYSEYDLAVFRDANEVPPLVISMPQALAAPDLLACCKSVLLRLDAEAYDLGGRNPVFVCGGMRDSLRTAIANATPAQGDVT